MNESEIDNRGGEPDDFEQYLLRALRRTDAPEGFVARVLEKVEPRDDTSLTRWLRSPRFRLQAWAAAAVVVLALGVLVANQVRLWRQRVQIARIQAQFETAMRITDHALDQTRAELERAGLKFGD